MTRLIAEPPDAQAQTQGRFAYTADLWVPGMQWCVLVRSPHPHARITGIDTSAALAVPGVTTVVTAADLPAEAFHGPVVVDRPVLASDVVAVHRRSGRGGVCRDAAWPRCAVPKPVEVEYEPLDARLDPEHAFASAPLHPDGNLFRHVALRHGRPVQRRPDGSPVEEVVVEGLYDIAAQDQLNPATDAVLALPCADGGIELHTASPWPHADRDQVAQCLGFASGTRAWCPRGRRIVRHPRGGRDARGRRVARGAAPGGRSRSSPTARTR
ncbi:hypothetical protein ACU686_06750 [Yinghuangia aomiensis]